MVCVVRSLGSSFLGAEELGKEGVSLWVGDADEDDRLESLQHVSWAEEWKRGNPAARRSRMKDEGKHLRRLVRETGRGLTGR